MIFPKRQKSSKLTGIAGKGNTKPSPAHENFETGGLRQSGCGTLKLSSRMYRVVL